MSESGITRETGRVAAPRVFAIVAAWFLFVILALSVLLALVDLEPEPSKPPRSNFFPNPRLITKPEWQMRPYAREQANELGAKSGPLKMPIERAMQENAKRRDPYAPIGGGQP